MTHSKSYRIRCDGEKCVEWVSYTVTNAEYAVRCARKDGWSSPEWGTHYCPDCRGGGHGAE